MAIVSIILGGGQGARLFPLTRDRSKPAVPIGGKYRLVDIPISNSLNAGIHKIFLLTQFNSVSLHKHLHRTYRFDYFSNASVELLAAEQTLSTNDWFQGTADAVRKHMSNYHLEDDDEVLILSGDHLYRIDLQRIIQLLREKNADFVVATTPVKRKEVQEFGIMQLDAQARIVGFKEKPKRVTKADSYQGKYLASMGIYAFRAHILKEVLRGNESDFGKELIPNNILQYNSYGFVFDGYWRDIGTIRSYYETSLDLACPNAQFSFMSQHQRIFTRPRFLPPNRIMNTKIKGALLSEGVQIEGAKIDHSVIGMRSIIRGNVSIKNSILMGSDYYEEDAKNRIPIGIAANCVIKNAIIDKNVRIGPDVKIVNSNRLKHFDGNNYYIREGIVVVPKNATIKANTVI